MYMVVMGPVRVKALWAGEEVREGKEGVINIRVEQRWVKLVIINHRGVGGVGVKMASAKCEGMERGHGSWLRQIDAIEKNLWG